MTPPDRLLICTDLDGTLIPNGPAPLSPGAHARFMSLAAHPRVELAYVSGRDIDLIERATQDNHLPVPDYIIANVGTSLYQPEAGRGWRRLAGWEAYIGRDWAKTSHRKLAAMLADLAALRIQEPCKQNRYKLSYYLSPDCNPEALDAEIHSRLDSNGIRGRLVWSEDPVDCTILLDIIPHSASKLPAIGQLMKLHGFTAHNTVFCGDSGNDLDVFASPLKAIVVANATQTIKAKAREQSARAGNESRLYFAQGGYRCMNGNYCAGLLEGVAHYFPATTDWMRYRPALHSATAARFPG